MHGVSEKAAGAPAAVYWLTEPARGLANLASLPLAARWLATAPRGDGHGVLVLPGFLSSDASTSTLRRFLRRAGVHGARLESRAQSGSDRPGGR